MARDIALLTNPTSGKGLGARTAAIALPRLREAGFRVRELQGADAGEAQDLARRAVADGVESLVVVGGDGMVHLAAQVLAHTGTALGIIPSGTGNDAARALGIPRRDPQAAADVVVAGRTRTIDLAKAGPTYVVNVVSAGFDAVVNERANDMRWPRGQMRYNLATVAELRTFEPIDYVLDLDGTTKRVRAMLVAVGNGPSFGGGLRITEGALLDDGRLDVVFFHPVSKPQLLRTFPKLFRGTHTSHPAYEHHRVRQVTIAARGIVAYGDGERMASLPLTVTAVPAALRVHVGPAVAETP
ncbi:YegS/Rv2252/BmrU family lipid kinase [Nocardioides sp. HDW12B]|uniref:diacylglycerol/lipid kinase family protein n=1 Tax=Nocardioides sp. HDW12B TaxID=2714939 RepID=UPI00140A06A5|nr:YegS/Rv2252/BmrU family lipid kinase [Nocardioides sp. HDW12B]QIK66443.1 YegS/Rv2252/BmrU family lipid kinase [Nocardioides sp. HDW12B]